MSDPSHPFTNIRSLNKELFARYLEENGISLEVCQILEGPVIS